MENLSNRGADTIHTWLALGDSYTIGESVSATERFPVLAAKMLENHHIYFKNPEFIAVTGWTTSDLLDAMHHYPIAPNYDIVSLLIGVNNQYQKRSQSEYRRQFTELIELAIHLADDRPSHVIVLSIPDYSVTPFAHDQDKNSIAEQIDLLNLINKTLSAEFQVQYVDITKESKKAAKDPSLIAIDGLHFSGKEYAIWAKMLAELILERSLVR